MCGRYRAYSSRRSHNRRSHTVNCDVDLNYSRSHTTPQNADLNKLRSHGAPQNADLNTAICLVLTQREKKGAGGGEQESEDSEEDVPLAQRKIARV